MPTAGRELVAKLFYLLTTVPADFGVTTVVPDDLVPCPGTAGGTVQFGPVSKAWDVGRTLSLEWLVLDEHRV